MEFPGDGNQSLKCATTFSKNDYAFLTEIAYSVRRNQTGEADIFLKVRNKGGVFRTQYVGGTSDQAGTNLIRFEPYLIIPKNSDIMLTAVASANNMSVSGTMNFFLASIQNG